MREIKFRAWDKMGAKWNYYDLEKIVNGEQSTFGALETRAGNKPCQYERISISTGLRDRNEKEIYEGDLMKLMIHYPNDYQEKYPWNKHGRVAGPVEWDGGYWYIDRKHDGNEVLLTESKGEDYEVIGNIYENPELINQ